MQTSFANSLTMPTTGVSSSKSLVAISRARIGMMPLMRIAIRDRLLLARLARARAAHCAVQSFLCHRSLNAVSKKVFPFPILCDIS